MKEKPPVEHEISASSLAILIDPSYRELIEEINNKYLYWDKIKYKVPKGINKSEFFAAVKYSRHGTTIEFAGKAFSFCETSEMQRILHLFDMSGGGLWSIDAASQKQRDYYILSSIAEEAIASSQMEGASTTREKAKEMIFAGAKPKDKSQRMIINNYRTIEYLRENRSSALTREFILEIHRRITENTLDNSENEGRFRQSNDIVVADSVSGEIVHFPPDYAGIEAGIAAICEFANNKSGEFMHPVVKAIIIHFMLSYLHPFVDDNGRTARSLFYWYMLKEGYWLTEFLAISRVIYRTKSQYEESFLHTEADDGDLGYFVHYNLIALQKALAELKEYLDRKQNEANALLQFKNIKGINERQAQIIKLFAANRDSIFTSKNLVSSFSVSEKTIRSDLEQLADMGILERIPKNKRLVGYAASDKFDLMIKGNRGNQQ